MDALPSRMFMNGNSQALPIPAEFQLATDRVQISCTPRRFWSSSPCPARRVQAPIDTNILIYVIKILLPQVAERIYALADDDYLAKSLIRIAGLQPRP